MPYSEFAGSWSGVGGLGLKLEVVDTCRDYMRRSLDLVILHPTLGVLAVMDAACRPGLVGPAGDVDARDVYAEPGTPVATPGIVGVGFVEGAFACLIDTHLYDVAFDARQALLRVADFSANEIRHGGGEPVATFALRSLFSANEVRPRRRRLGRRRFAH